MIKQIEMADSKIVNQYEYAIESIINSLSGKSQIEAMLSVIKKYTEDGWKVHTIYSNELGKNVIGFMGVGINSTQSEDIIIFERHVQYSVQCHTQKDLLVTNYCGDLPVRFGLAQMYIPQNSDHFQFAIAGKYGSGIAIEAFRLDAEFVTIFDERISVKNLSFITIDEGNRNFVTSPYEVQLNKNEIRLIKAVKLYVKSYVSESKSYTVEGKEYIDVTEDSLSLFQKDVFGQDYFRQYEENLESWTCTCGKINDTKVSICPICGRKRENLRRNELEDFNEIIVSAEKMANAKEIYDWISEYNKERNNEKIAKLLQELLTIKEIERMYGNAQGEAITKIKEFACTDEI